MLGDWFAPRGQAATDNADLLDEIHRRDRRADAPLAGRRTFEQLRGYRPQQSDDPTGVSDYLNRILKYVVSSTMTDAQWPNSAVLAGDPVDDVRVLKSSPARTQS
jgi:hypothetical protein